MGVSLTPRRSLFPRNLPEFIYNVPATRILHLGAHLQSLWSCPSLSKCSDSADHTRLSLSTASQRTFTGGGRYTSWWWLDFAEEEENFHLQQLKKKKEGKLYECCVFRVCVLLIFVQFISQVFARHKFFYLIIIVHRRVTRPTADALNEH